VDLPPVDGLALCAAHEGRSHLMKHWIDPSLTDEHDALSVDASLDMYDPANQPFSGDFLQRFRQAQAARLARIETWVDQRLQLLRSQTVPGHARDETFLIYRTHADPRFLNLGMDRNDRTVGSVWGEGAAGARAVNYAASQMGRITSLTAFLSQWSSRSRADGPTNLARSRAPVLLCTYTADHSTFPSTRDAWIAAAGGLGGGRIQAVDIVGGNHYLAGQPTLVEQTADAMAEWMHKL
jgi:hypothetical protein